MDAAPQERSERRVIAYWWATGLLYLVLGAAFVVAPLGWALALSLDADGARLVALVGAVLGGLSVVSVLVGAPIRHRILAFRVDERALWVRSGLFVHREKTVPASRLQHVDVVRGPIERLFGLASLVVYTAGGGAATYRLAGLLPERAEALRAEVLRAAEQRAGDGS